MKLRKLNIHHIDFQLAWEWKIRTLNINWFKKNIIQWKLKRTEKHDYVNITKIQGHKLWSTKLFKVIERYPGTPICLHHFVDKSLSDACWSLADRVSLSSICHIFDFLFLENGSKTKINFVFLFFKNGFSIDLEYFISCIFILQVINSLEWWSFY